jgi:hypothetical protein
MDSTSTVMESGNTQGRRKDDGCMDDNRSNTLSNQRSTHPQSCSAHPTFHASERSDVVRVVLCFGRQIHIPQIPSPPHPLPLGKSKLTFPLPL